MQERNKAMQPIFAVPYGQTKYTKPAFYAFAYGCSVETIAKILNCKRRIAKKHKKRMIAEAEVLHKALIKANNTVVSINRG